VREDGGRDRHGEQGTAARHYGHGRQAQRWVSGGASMTGRASVAGVPDGTHLAGVPDGTSLADEVSVAGVPDGTSVADRPSVAGVPDGSRAAGVPSTTGMASRPSTAGVPDGPGLADAVRRVADFPRLRYMGSKYRLIPHLAGVFAEVGGRTALDAFSGSGVVSYLLKTLGYEVTANDFLTFPAVIARATVVNQKVTLSAADIDEICGPAADDRDFIQCNFGGVYFTDADRAFLDSAWSHIDRMDGHKQAVAIAALVLAAARKQPRGVFTFTGLRYDDGRRDLRLGMREHFRERAAEYNRVVFDSGRPCTALHGDVFAIEPGPYDVVYLDPPYAPARDDNCYIKRYHFLEGLSVYWRGQPIMQETRTRKLAKRYTPFSYKRTVTDALRRAFGQFPDSVIVASYSSNAVPDAATIEALLREVKDDVEVRLIDHSYSFGTHPAALRRAASEYLFIGR
jgi:adenine-specific DNA-methyltransferase